MSTVPTEGALPARDAQSTPDAEQAATRAWALARGGLSLETATRTRLYWSAVALVSLSVFIPALLPCVDYPQHLALSDVARRLANPSAPEHAAFQVNWLTYNGLFHLVVAKLGAVMPIELAGRVVVSFSLASLGVAVLLLLKLLERPASYAGLFVPAIFSFSIGWGFVNYALATSIAVWALLLVALMLKRPSLAVAYALIGVGLLCAFAHVLAMLLLCMLAASLAPEVSWRASAKEGRGLIRQAGIAILRMAGALSPLLVGCIYCVGIYDIQYDWDPHMYKDPTIEGTAPAIWQKLVLFQAYATNLHRDRSDQVIIVLVVGVMLGLAAAVNLDLHCALFAYETNDASRVINDLPEGRRVTVVNFHPPTLSFLNGTLVHLSAYYAARKHGEWAFAFARYLSVPVRFRPGTQPAWPEHGWEFDGDRYDARCKYARYYDLVIVRQPVETPEGAEAEAFVRKAAFKGDASAVRLVSHHGAYWAFDTKGLPGDGTL